MAKEKDPVPKEVLEEGYFHPKSWMREGLFLILLGSVVSLIVTRTLDFEEYWDFYAIGMGILIAAGVPFFLRPRLSRSVCAVIAILSIIAAELILYWLVFSGG